MQKGMNRMMKKKWNRTGILLLIFSMLLAGYSGNTAAAQTPFQVTEAAKGKAAGVPFLSGKTAQAHKKLPNILLFALASDFGAETFGRNESEF